MRDRRRAHSLRLSAEIGFFLGILGALLLFGRSKLLQDPDTFWHVVVGRQILQTGDFPRVDTFSWTRFGEPWIAHQWLGECLLAIVDRLAGFDGLVVVTAAAVALVFAWAAGKLVRTGLNWLVAALVIALALAAGAYNLHARPHISSIVLLGLTFGLLCDVDAGRAPLRRLWWLVPLCLVWTNLHGGVLGGWGTAGLAFAGWTVFALLGWASPLARRTDCQSVLHEPAELCLILAACALTFFINPYGIETPRTWHTIMSADLPDLIVEHAPLSPTRPEGVMVLVMAALFLLVLLTVRRSGRGANAQHPGGEFGSKHDRGGLESLPSLRVTWLLPLVWLYLATSRIRHGALFGVVSTLAIAEMLPHSRVADWLARRDFFRSPEAIPLASEHRLPPRTPWLRTAGFVFLILFGAATLGRQAAPPSVAGRVWARPHPSVWPEELLPAIRQFADSSPPGTPILNGGRLGGFLIDTAPTLRVSVDGRCELYGEQFLRDYLALSDDPDRIEAWAQEFGIQAALVEAGTPLDQRLRQAGSWRVVESTQTATWLVRQAQPAPGDAAISGDSTGSP